MALYSIPETQGLLLNLELGWQQQASTIFLSLPSTMLGLQGLHIIPGFLCVSQEFKSSSSYLSSKRSYPLRHLPSPLCFFLLLLSLTLHFIYLLCGGWHVHSMWWEVRGQLAGVKSLLPLCRAQRSNSGLQARQQVFLLAFWHPTLVF